MDAMELYDVVFALLFFGTMLFALVAGRSPERWAAGVLFAALLLTWLVQALVGTDAAAMLAVDTALLAVLAIILFRYKRLWTGVMVCSQVVLFSFSATRFTQFPLSDFEYLVVLNVSSFGVIASLLAGAISARWGDDPEADAQLWGYRDIEQAPPHRVVHQLHGHAAKISSTSHDCQIGRPSA